MRPGKVALFGILIICYLFLGGLGAGLCLVFAAIGLSVPGVHLRQGILLEQRRFFQAGFTAACVILVAATLLLLADVGAYAALPALFLSGKTTYLNVGAYLLVAAIALSLLLTWLWSTRPHIKWRKSFAALHVVAAVIALAVALYTGLFLADMRAVPLWNTPWLPALFALSALSCGLVGAPVIAQVLGILEQFERYFKRLSLADAAVLLLQAGCMTGLLISTLPAGDANPTLAAAVNSAVTLIAGPQAWVFWGGFVAVGVVVALAMDIAVARLSAAPSQHPYLSLAPLSCVLVGAFALRFGLVEAGAHPVATLIGV
jgi:formate-dependent nitrite reductase membrane component NrfD